MDDKAFDELKLKMAIAPGQARWPEPKYFHWQKLHAVPDEARQRVNQALAAMDAVDANPDLSPPGKKRECAKIAEQAIADFQRSATLENAHSAVAQQQERWAAKIGEIVKPPEDIGAATTYMQIRDRVADMKEGRLAFLDKHAGDPVVASAVLSAPAFLSGLSDTEFAVVKSKIEKHFISAEITEAKAATEKAMQEAEQGWHRAIDMITQRGGFEKKAAVA